MDRYNNKMDYLQMFEVVSCKVALDRSQVYFTLNIPKYLILYEYSMLRGWHSI